MKYVGKLFGQIGRTRGYFDTGKTSEDWDALEARAERAEASLHALRLVCGTTDADKFTTWVDRAIARAERAEAALHALRLVCGTTDAARFSTWVDRANARAEKAEAERIALVKANAELDHAYRTLHGRLVTAQAEHAAERARLDWLEDHGWVTGEPCDRAAIDAAMGGGPK